MTNLFSWAIYKRRLPYSRELQDEGAGLCPALGNYCKLIKKKLRCLRCRIVSYFKIGVYRLLHHRAENDFTFTTQKETEGYCLNLGKIYI